MPVSSFTRTAISIPAGQLRFGKRRQWLSFDTHDDNEVSSYIHPYPFHLEGFAILPIKLKSMCHGVQWLSGISHADANRSFGFICRGGCLQQIVLK